MFFYVFVSGDCNAQMLVKTEYLTRSSFMEDEENKIGSGDLLKISGRYSMPLSVKRYESGRPIMWIVSAVGSYGILNNKGMAKEANPNNILNVSLNLAHTRPISDKWYLIMSSGLGIYSVPDAISTKSILFNGGVIFIRKIRNTLDLGIGLGLTNSYGIPLAMPMSIIKWELPGKYEVNADIANGMEISISVKLTDKLKLKLIAMELDGMSSIMNIEEKSMIYATTIMKSYLSVEYKPNRSVIFYIGAGSAWMRSVTITNRNLKDFFSNLFHNNRKLDFKGTTYITAGLRYGYK